MDLDTTRAFVKVVQFGSFTKAAAFLRLPKSSVSRMLSRLESETGTKLLLRTTRQLKLTAAGLAFYESCLGPLQQLEDARKSLQGKDSIIAGPLRITAPEDLGSHFLSSVLGKLTRQHPGLTFEFNYTDKTLDLVRGGYDIAVRIGKLNPSGFKVRKQGTIVLGPVASPDYLRSKPKVGHPQELTSHDCLDFTPHTSQTRWTLRAGNRVQSVVVNPKVVGNQMTSLVKLAEEGAGIALVPLYLCRPQLQSQTLVRVLPDWVGPSVPVSIVLPIASGGSARLKLVIEHLSAAVQSALG